MNTLKGWQRRNRFKELVYLGDQVKTDSSEVPRLYVLVRDDILPPLHQGIQAAHACLQLAAVNPVDPNSYLILLGATEKQMLALVRKVARTGMGFAIYSDAGLIHPETGAVVMTACAFSPMSIVDGNRLFGHLSRAV